MARTLFILNDAPYGTERSYNGLRLAGSVAKRDGEVVKIFLIGDAAGCAHSGQKVPKGYYNVEVMLRSVIRHGALVGVCGSCMDARGLDQGGLAKGVPSEFRGRTHRLDTGGRQRPGLLIRH